MSDFRSFFLFLMLLPVGVAIGAVPAPPPTPQTATSPTLVVTPPKVVTDAREDILKAELQVMKDFTQHILSTVYFALATIVLVLLALVGYNWYQNQKVYERDRAAMEASLSTSAAENLAKAELSLKKIVAERIEAHEVSNKESFAHFDKRMAEVFEIAMRRNAETYLSLTASLYNDTHSEPTPRTDLLGLILLTQSMIGRVDVVVLKTALQIIVGALERTPEAKHDYQTLLLDLARQLPAECEAHAIRLRAFAA